MPGVAAAIAAALIVAALAPPAGAYVYVGANGSAIARTNLDGSGADASFVNLAPDLGNEIAVDGGHIYWLDALDHVIGRANLDGTDVVPAFISDPDIFGGLAVDANHIYWTDSTSIQEADLDGSDPTTLVTSAFVKKPLELAIDNGDIYWTNSSTNDIGRATITGGSPTESFITSANDGGSAVGIAVNGSFIYWTNEQSNAIGRANLDGASPNPVFIASAFSPNSLAVDANYLYWSNNGGPDTVERATLDGVSVDGTFISGLPTPVSVAVDGLVNTSATSVSCRPSALVLPNAATCTVTVSDPTSPTPSAPTGSVALSSNTAGDAFGLGSTCTLTPEASSQSGCQLSFLPGAVVSGSHVVTVTYGGDGAHSGSSGTVSVVVSPAPKPARAPVRYCLVPNVKGKSLARSRTLLSSGRCKLGKVTKPRVRRGHKLKGTLVVAAQGRRAGIKLPVNTSVALRLGLASVKRTPRRK